MEKAFADLAAELASEIEFEFEKGLIAAVRAFRCLFACNHEYYNNIVHNKVAWQQISHCLKKSVLDCVNRWYTLVQAFLYYHQKNICSNEPITWPHYEAFEELQPFMVTKYTDLIQTKQPPMLYSKPNPIQRETLLNELIANRIKLLNSETPIEQLQRIWANLAEKLNNMGPKMPIIKWQRCWWEMKVRFGGQMWQIQRRQHSCVGAPPKEFLSAEEMKIMSFCGANALHSYSPNIAVVLDSYIEFGCNREKSIPKCRKCSIFLNDSSSALCDVCRQFPNRCDICLQMFEQKQKLVLYQLRDWTLRAKSLLPPSYQTYAELSMCTNCSNALQKEAATTWKVCRVCEKSHPLLDNLFSNTNEHLLEVFQSATNITFTETEGLPGYICNICKIQMQQFNNFYLRFCRAQCRLKEVHTTKFIPFDSPEEEVKASNLENPKTYLIKRDIPSVPLSAVKSTVLFGKRKPPKGTYILNPEITSGPVIATPPYNTLVEATPAKGFTKVFPVNKVSSRLISKAGRPALKRVYLTKPQTVPVVAESSTTSAAVPAKRVCIAPTKTKGVVSLQPSPYPSKLGPVKIVTAPSTPATGVLKLQQGTASVVSPLPAATKVCAVTAGHAPVQQFPTTGVTVAKRVPANPPAVFTISGDNQHNLPPAFCIPKSMNYIQQPMSALAAVEIQPPQQSPPPTIKTENLDESYPTPPNNKVPPSDVSSNASAVSMRSTCKAPVLKNINQIQLDGPTAVVKPNEQIFPLLTNSPNAFHNVFLNANKDIFEPKKPKCAPSVPLMETVSTNLNSEKPPPNAPNVTEEPQPQQPQPRVRKYWGLVDEFQITSVPDKANANPKPSCSQPEQLPMQPAKVVPEIEIKEEGVDNQPSMFYPDSFELNNGAPGDDVSLMINTMMTEQEPIDEEDSFKYINPSFLMSYVENESTKDASEAENKETAPKEPKDTPTEKAKPEEDTSAIHKATCQLSAAEAHVKVNTKTLRVKLKRSDRLKKLSSGQMRRRSSQPSRSIPTRKSLRSLIAQKTTN